MILLSERLKYRTLTEQDFQLFYSVFSNELVMRYAWIDKFNSEEEASQFFKESIHYNDLPNKSNGYALATYRNDDDSFVGIADILIHSKNSNGGCGEIGYFLLPDFWGKGYATELSNCLLKFGFTELKLHKISARCDSNNYKSEGVMKKVGMTMEGELRRVRFKNGNWDDEKHYGILLEEWNTR